MFHHEFIVDNYTIWVGGDVSKLEAFASICPVPANQCLLGATPLDRKELDKLPRPTFGTVTVVRRPLPAPRDPSPDTQAIQSPQRHANVLYLRHKHVVPTAVLQTLERLEPGASCSVVALRQQEDLHLPSLDYSLTNSKLSPQLCHLLLQKTGLVAAQGRQASPPQHATLTVRLYGDGYQPRGRSDISTQICLLDFEVLWFPLAGFLPHCIDMISWLELPETVDAE